MSTKTYTSLISAMTVLAGLAVIVCIFLTNPRAIGPLGVTLWFVALLTFIQGALALGLIWAKQRFLPALAQHRLVTSSWRQGLLMGGGIVMLLGLASLRQLGWRDAMLLTGLLGLVEFYFRARA